MGAEVTIEPLIGGPGADAGYMIPANESRMAAPALTRGGETRPPRRQRPTPLRGTRAGGRAGCRPRGAAPRREPNGPNGSSRRPDGRRTRRPLPVARRHRPVRRCRQRPSRVRPNIPTVAEAMEQALQFRGQADERVPGSIHREVVAAGVDHGDLAPEFGHGAKDAKRR